MGMWPQHYLCALYCVMSHRLRVIMSQIILIYIMFHKSTEVLPTKYLAHFGIY